MNIELCLVLTPLNCIGTSIITWSMFFPAVLNKLNICLCMYNTYSIIFLFLTDSYVMIGTYKRSRKDSNHIHPILQCNDAPCFIVHIYLPISNSLAYFLLMGVKSLIHVLIPTPMLQYDIKVPTHSAKMIWLAFQYWLYRRLSHWTNWFLPLPLWLFSCILIFYSVCCR